MIKYQGETFDITNRESPAWYIFLTLNENSCKGFQTDFPLTLQSSITLFFCPFHMPAEPFRVIWDYWLWSSKNLSHCKQGDSRLSLRSLFNQSLRSSNGFYSTVLLRLRLLFKLLLLVEKWPLKKFKICRFNVPNTSFHAPFAPLFKVNSSLRRHVCAGACACKLVSSSCLQVLQY